jgi:hypothetical protein
MESIISKASTPKINSIYCLIAILGYVNTLDRVAPVTKRLNRYFRDLINSGIKSGKLFQSIVTNEVYLQFLQITPPTTFEQTKAWWKSFYGKEIDNEEILYKVVCPLKF